MKTLNYTTVDKSDWGPGPWQDEPDKIQWQDAKTQLPCLVNRGPGSHWCGYVGVPPGHPAHGLGYDEVYELSPDWGDGGYLSVHGGLTFSAGCSDGPEESSICHIPDPGEPDDVWWLGFDCAHLFDLSPKYRAMERKRYEETGDPIWLPFADEKSVYRDLGYVRDEITALAAQLRAVTAA